LLAILVHFICLTNKPEVFFFFWGVVVVVVFFVLCFFFLKQLANSYLVFHDESFYKSTRQNYKKRVEK